jgi:glutamine cyclotransferase
MGVPILAVRTARLPALTRKVGAVHIEGNCRLVCEKLLEMLPVTLRKALARTLSLKAWLGITLVSLIALCVPFTSCSRSPKPITSPSPEDTTHSDTTVIVYTYNIVNVYPHDRNAFTEGLVFENGFLYEGTGGYGGSSVRKVQLETGTVLQMHLLPTIYFGEGIVIHENKIIELTWKSHVGFIFDKTSLDSLGAFYYPTEGWGITYDGTHLIMSDGTSMLRFWDPLTLAQVDSIQVFDDTLAVTELNELEYIKGKIYANVWKSDRVAIISPQTGQVESWIDLSGLLSPGDKVPPIDVLNGIAYDKDNDRLFVTGKWWPKLFEIEIVPKGGPSPARILLLDEPQRKTRLGEAMKDRVAAPRAG